ncbi:MAG: response regulator [Pirellulales bacterium]|nr:response regulator [Pirellulales bacterium]
MNTSNCDRLRVLVVDNLRDYVDATVLLLRTAFQCDARGCLDGELAVEVMTEFEPHLLLLDIAMPKADGFAVIAQLKKRNMVPPYVVAVSGYAGEAITNRCLRAGFHHNVAKPTSLDTIKELVAESQRRAFLAPAS